MECTITPVIRTGGTSVMLNAETFSQIVQILKNSVVTKRLKYQKKVDILWAVWRHATLFLSACPPNVNEVVFNDLFESSLKLIFNGNFFKIDFNLKCNLQKAVGHFLNTVPYTRYPKILETTKLLSALIANPWYHPVLHKIINGMEADENDISSYLKSQHYTIILTRLEVLLQSACSEMAARLSGAALDIIESHECVSCKPDPCELLFLHLLSLYKNGEENQILNKLLNLPVSITNSLLTVKLEMRFLRKDMKSLIEFVANALLVIAVLRDLTPNRVDAFQELLTHWAAIIAPTVDEALSPVLHDGIRRLLISATSSKHISLFGKFLLHKYGNELAGFCKEICVLSLTVNINEMLYLRIKNDDAKIRECEIHLSQGYEYLSNLYQADAGISRECLLTAFSLNPTESTFKLIEEAADKKPVDNSPHAITGVNNVRSVIKKTVPLNVKANPNRPTSSSVLRPIPKDIEGCVMRKTVHFVSSADGIFSSPYNEIPPKRGPVSSLNKNTTKKKFSVAAHLLANPPNVIAQPDTSPSPASSARGQYEINVTESQREPSLYNSGLQKNTSYSENVTGNNSLSSSGRRQKITYGDILVYPNNLSDGLHNNEKINNTYVTQTYSGNSASDNGSDNAQLPKRANPKKVYPRLKAYPVIHKNLSSTYGMHVPSENSSLRNEQFKNTEHQHSTNSSNLCNNDPFENLYGKQVYPRIEVGINNNLPCSEQVKNLYGTQVYSGAWQTAQAYPRNVGSNSSSNSEQNNAYGKQTFPRNAASYNNLQDMDQVKMVKTIYGTQVHQRTQQHAANDNNISNSADLPKYGKQVYPRIEQRSQGYPRNAMDNNSSFDSGNNDMHGGKQMFPRSADNENSYITKKIKNLLHVTQIHSVIEQHDTSNNGAKSLAYGKQVYPRTEQHAQLYPRNAVGNNSAFEHGDQNTNGDKQRFPRNCAGGSNLHDTGKVINPLCGTAKYSGIEQHIASDNSSSNSAELPKYGNQVYPRLTDQHGQVYTRNVVGNNSAFQHGHQNTSGDKQRFPRNPAGGSNLHNTGKKGSIVYPGMEQHAASDNNSSNCTELPKYGKQVYPRIEQHAQVYQRNTMGNNSSFDSGDSTHGIQIFSNSAIGDHNLHNTGMGMNVCTTQVYPRRVHASRDISSSNSTELSMYGKQAYPRPEQHAQVYPRNTIGNNRDYNVHGSKQVLPKNPADDRSLIHNTVKNGNVVYPCVEQHAMSDNNSPNSAELPMHGKQVYPRIEQHAHLFQKSAMTNNSSFDSGDNNTHNGKQIFLGSSASENSLCNNAELRTYGKQVYPSVEQHAQLYQKDAMSNDSSFDSGYNNTYGSKQIFPRSSTGDNSSYNSAELSIYGKQVYPRTEHAQLYKKNSVANNSSFGSECSNIHGGKQVFPRSAATDNTLHNTGQIKHMYDTQVFPSKGQCGTSDNSLSNSTQISMYGKQVYPRKEHLAQMYQNNAINSNNSCSNPRKSNMHGKQVFLANAASNNDLHCSDKVNTMYGVQLHHRMEQCATSDNSLSNSTQLPTYDKQHAQMYQRNAMSNDSLSNTRQNNTYSKQLFPRNATSKNSLHSTDKVNPISVAQLYLTMESHTTSSNSLCNNDQLNTYDKQIYPSTEQDATSDNSLSNSTQLTIYGKQVYPRTSQHSQVVQKNAISNDSSSNTLRNNTHSKQVFLTNAAVNNNLHSSDQVEIVYDAQLHLRTEKNLSNNENLNLHYKQGLPRTEQHVQMYPKNSSSDIGHAITDGKQIFPYNEQTKKSHPNQVCATSDNNLHNIQQVKGTNTREDQHCLSDGSLCNSEQIRNPCHPVIDKNNSCNNDQIKEASGGSSAEINQCPAVVCNNQVDSNRPKSSIDNNNKDTNNEEAINAKLNALKKVLDDMPVARMLYPSLYMFNNVEGTDGQLGRDVASDLASVISFPRHRVLSWSLNWPQLRHNCLLYMKEFDQINSCRMAPLRYLDIRSALCSDDSYGISSNVDSIDRHFSVIEEEVVISDSSEYDDLFVVSSSSDSSSSNNSNNSSYDNGDSSNFSIEWHSDGDIYYGSTTRKGRKYHSSRKEDESSSSSDPDFLPSRSNKRKKSRKDGKKSNKAKKPKEMRKLKSKKRMRRKKKKTSMETEEPEILIYNTQVEINSVGHNAINDRLYETAKSLEKRQCKTTLNDGLLSKDEIKQKNDIDILSSAESGNRENTHIKLIIDKNVEDSVDKRQNTPLSDITKNIQNHSSCVAESPVQDVNITSAGTGHHCWLQDNVTPDITDSSRISLSVSSAVPIEGPQSTPSHVENDKTKVVIVPESAGDKMLYVEAKSNERKLISSEETQTGHQKSSNEESKISCKESQVETHSIEFILIKSPTRKASQNNSSHRKLQCSPNVDKSSDSTSLQTPEFQEEISPLNKHTPIVRNTSDSRLLEYVSHPNIDSDKVCATSSIKLDCGNDPNKKLDDIREAATNQTEHSKTKLSECHTLKEIRTELCRLLKHNNLINKECDSLSGNSDTSFVKHLENNLNNKSNAQKSATTETEYANMKLSQCHTSEERKTKSHELERQGNPDKESNSFNQESGALYVKPNFKNDFNSKTDLEINTQEEAATSKTEHSSIKVSECHTSKKITELCIFTKESDTSSIKPYFEDDLNHKIDTQEATTSEAEICNEKLSECHTLEDRRTQLHELKKCDNSFKKCNSINEEFGALDVKPHCKNDVKCKTDLEIDTQEEVVTRKTEHSSIKLSESHTLEEKTELCGLIKEYDTSLTFESDLNHKIDTQETTASEAEHSNPKLSECHTLEEIKTKLCKLTNKNDTNKECSGLHEETGALYVKPHFENDFNNKTDRGIDTQKAVSVSRTVHPCMKLPERHTSEEITKLCGLITKSDTSSIKPYFENDLNHKTDVQQAAANEAEYTGTKLSECHTLEEIRTKLQRLTKHNNSNKGSGALSVKPYFENDFNNKTDLRICTQEAVATSETEHSSMKLLGCHTPEESTTLCRLTKKSDTSSVKPYFKKDLSHKIDVQKSFMSEAEHSGAKLTKCQTLEEIRTKLHGLAIYCNSKKECNSLNEESLALSLKPHIKNDINNKADLKIDSQEVVAISETDPSSMKLSEYHASEESTKLRGLTTESESDTSRVKPYAENDLSHKTDSRECFTSEKERSDAKLTECHTLEEIRTKLRRLLKRDNVNKECIGLNEQSDTVSIKSCIGNELNKKTDALVDTPEAPTNEMEHSDTKLTGCHTFEEIRSKLRRLLKHYVVNSNDTPQCKKPKLDHRGSDTAAAGCDDEGSSAVPSLQIITDEFSDLTIIVCPSSRKLQKNKKVHLCTNHVTPKEASELQSLIVRPYDTNSDPSKVTCVYYNDFEELIKNPLIAVDDRRVTSSNSSSRVMAVGDNNNPPNVVVIKRGIAVKIINCNEKLQPKLGDDQSSSMAISSNNFVKDDADVVAAVTAAKYEHFICVRDGLNELVSKMYNVLIKVYRSGMDQYEPVVSFYPIGEKQVCTDLGLYYEMSNSTARTITDDDDDRVVAVETERTQVYEDDKDTEDLRIAIRTKVTNTVVPAAANSGLETGADRTLFETIRLQMVVTFKLMECCAQIHTAECTLEGVDDENSNASSGYCDGKVGEFCCRILSHSGLSVTMDVTQVMRHYRVSDQLSCHVLRIRCLHLTNEEKEDTAPMEMNTHPSTDPTKNTQSFGITEI